MEAELSAAASDESRDKIRADFATLERSIEHDIDHKPLDLHLSLQVAYNFLSK